MVSNFTAGCAIPPGNSSAQTTLFESLYDEARNGTTMGYLAATVAIQFAIIIILGYLVTRKNDKKSPPAQWEMRVPVLRFE